MTPEQFKRVLTTIRFDPTAAQSPSPAPALTQHFISPRLGYSIAYPDGWSTTPASTSAAAGSIVNYGDPTFDVLQGTTARLVVGSQPLAPGQTPEDWVVHYCSLYESPGTDCAGAPAHLPRITVGSTEGWVQTDGAFTIESVVADGGRYFDIVVATGGRGYSFTLDGLVERPLMDALMASVTLDPASAVDSP